MLNNGHENNEKRGVTNTVVSFKESIHYFKKNKNKKKAIFLSFRRLEEMFFLELGHTSHDLRLNATLIVATTNLEKAIVPPVIVPAICHEPIVSPRLNTPTKYLDCMPTKSLSSCVLVNAALVGQKVTVYGESCLDRTMSHDFSHNFLNTSNTIGRCAIVLVVGVCLKLYDNIK